MTTETKVMGGILAVTIILLLIFGFSSRSKPLVVESRPQTIDATGAVATGPENAAVTIVEFADFQCPACGQAHPIIKRILDDYEGKVRFVHRHFPLQIHDHAQAAAQASEAAREQDKFWEMHGLLFEHQDEWSNSNTPNDFFERYAEAIGLDMAKYRDFVKNKKGQANIDRDVQEGTNAKVDATPTFFINGQGLKGVPTYSDLKTRIDAVLSAQTPAS